jgi:hypothetical protein
VPTSKASDPSRGRPVEVVPQQPEPRLIYSDGVGASTIISDPEDLKHAEDLILDKRGARLTWANTDMLVKFSHGVRLAEAEALHLVSMCTTIAVPKLLSAYILGGVGYIIMSYEKGEPFERYWDRASKTRTRTNSRATQELCSPNARHQGRFY